MDWKNELIAIRRNTSNTEYTLITIDTYDWGMYVVKSVGNESTRKYTSRRFNYTNKYNTPESNLKRILSYYNISSHLVEVDWDDDSLDSFDKIFSERPNVADIPSDISDDDISDFLSDKYGFCVNSWMTIVKQ